MASEAAAMKAPSTPNISSISAGLARRKIRRAYEGR
jgi:hypothetical protein